MSLVLVNPNSDWGRVRKVGCPRFGNQMSVTPNLVNPNRDKEGK